MASAAFKRSLRPHRPALPLRFGPRDYQSLAPFSHPDWLFEIKYGGWRMLAVFGAGPPRLKTRAGNDCTTWFPEIVRALEPYDGGTYITDGEVAVLDDIGRSDFNRLQDRALRRGPGGEPVIYCMFDLLQAGRSAGSASRPA
jgi:bifunctional non-homologous end joining protein LigD